MIKKEHGIMRPYEPTYSIGVGSVYKKLEIIHLSQTMMLFQLFQKTIICCFGESMVFI
jgi:hypothetical protein